MLMQTIARVVLPLLVVAAWCPFSLAQDHFLFYRVRSAPVSEKVALKGQFDKGYVPAVVDRMPAFGNVVSKNEEPIKNRHAHLAWYSLHQEKEEPVRIVSASNQFGDLKFKTYHEVALLVPTEKVEPGSDFPKRVDHYKVYEVVSTPPFEKEVSLRDQFYSGHGRVGHLRFFAVPVSKRHGDTTTEIVDPRTHLAIYLLDPPPPVGKSREIVNQFGKSKVGFYRAVLLAVPTIKHGFEESD